MVLCLGSKFIHLFTFSFCLLIDVIEREGTVTHLWSYPICALPCSFAFSNMLTSKGQCLVSKLWSFALFLWLGPQFQIMVLCLVPLIGSTSQIERFTFSTKLIRAERGNCHTFMVTHRFIRVQTIKPTMVICPFHRFFNA